MQYRPYGKTGKQVSVIGYGGMRFHKTGGRWDLDACAELVQLAWQHGVNYFDTAPGYCEDQSEAIMGLAFQQMKGEYYVATKSGEKDGAALRRQLEKSLQRLGRQRLDFFHIWCVLTLDDYRARMAKGGACEAALKAQEEGLIEHLVFSTHCTGEEIATIVREAPFAGMTVGYNVVNHSFRRLGLEAAHAQGLGIATMNPLGGGLIPENAEFFDCLRSPGDATVAEAALRFNGGHREVTTVLAGMGTRDEVLANVRLGDSMPIRSPAELAAIGQRLAQNHNDLCTGCRYCEYCPEEIPVSKFMQAYNQKMLKNRHEAIAQMKWHWRVPLGMAEKCVACGECERRCTQHLPITARLEEMAGWPRD